jgi:hypothetical protein
MPKGTINIYLCLTNGDLPIVNLDVTRSSLRHIVALFELQLARGEHRF